jgi:signal transduction histidine kinase
MRSIRRHLTVVLTSLIAILLGAGSFLIYYSTRAALLNEIDARLRVEALAVVKQSRQDRDDEDELEVRKGSTNVVRRELEVAFTDKYMPEFQESGSEFFQVWARNDQFVFRSKSLKGGDLERREGTVERPAFWFLTLPKSRHGRAIALDFIPPTPERAQKWHDPNFKASLVVATSLHDFHKTLGVLRAVLASVAGVGLLVTLTAIPLVLRRGLSPLQEVAAHASTLEASNLRTRFESSNLPVELRPICEQLNALLSRLEISFEREKSFSADVAHELRTPIAELRSLSEVCIQWPEKGRQDSVFKDSLAIAKQMESIVASLLAISRCEAGGAIPSVSDVELNAMVEECMMPFLVEAKSKQLRYSISVPKPAMVRGNPAMLSLVLTNLISNAVTYSPQGGMFEIHYSVSSGTGVLKIKNSVTLLSPDDVPNLFKRFWRKDTVRSSSHHSGLGLALCKAYVEAMNMKLTAEFVGEHELLMALSIPTSSN